MHSSDRAGGPVPRSATRLAPFARGVTVVAVAASALFTAGCPAGSGGDPTQTPVGTSPTSPTTVPTSTAGSPTTPVTPPPTTPTATPGSRGSTTFTEQTPTDLSGP